MHYTFSHTHALVLLMAYIFYVNLEFEIKASRFIDTTND